ncbi:hypothetical protein [Paenibacillus elgii]|nr:hypothetical protein [Paenibacillus elgii]
MKPNSTIDSLAHQKKKELLEGVIQNSIRIGLRNPDGSKKKSKVAPRFTR